VVLVVRGSNAWPIARLSIAFLGGSVVCDLATGYCHYLITNKTVYTGAMYNVKVKLL
jgi:hypothetical protein